MLMSSLFVMIISKHRDKKRLKTINVKKKAHSVKKQNAPIKELFKIYSRPKLDKIDLAVFVYDIMKIKIAKIR